MPGLREIFEYRDLGIKDGTNGDYVAPSSDTTARGLLRGEPLVKRLAPTF